MTTTYVQRSTISKQPVNYVLIVLCLFLTIFLGKMILNYIDMPEKPVCSDIHSSNNPAGKFKPYYVECSTK